MLFVLARRALGARSRCWSRGPTRIPTPTRPRPTLELAIPLLEEVAGGRVDGIIGDTDPFVAVSEAFTSTGIDETIISTLPAWVSHWLRRDLPHRVEQFGLPVTIVTAQQSERAVSELD
jgi:hypothetical protein